MIKVKKMTELRNEKGPERQGEVELNPLGRDYIFSYNDKDEIKVRIYEAKKTKAPYLAYMMTLNNKLICDDEIILKPSVNELIKHLKSLGIRVFFSFSENEQMYVEIKL